MPTKSPPKSHLRELARASYEELLIAMGDSSLRAHALHIIGERAKAAAMNRAECDRAAIVEMPTWARERLVAAIRTDGPLQHFAKGELVRRDRASGKSELPCPPSRYETEHERKLS